MKITSRQLRQIIKEELRRTLNEARPFTKDDLMADVYADRLPDDWEEQDREIMSMGNNIHHATSGMGTDKSELMGAISKINTVYKYKHIDAMFQKQGGLLALINDEMDWLDAFAKIEIMETLNKNLKNTGLHFGIAGDPATGELVRY